MSLKHNKAFKWDSCRVAFLICGDFCGESGMRNVGLGGNHPLTQRYVSYQNYCFIEDRGRNNLEI
ncbi:DUF3265 domain-containing protein [Vibrio vulnificus]|nr:DUF3265 domain-containing protein [Vibrio vulnificus]POC34715.1 DUF3265 domain-containing protein [Vibrio vulnificus]POC52720.1 DUF3265 domain-containing protein [Vibrio vulnificus]POC72906.1 DUF3265 domain-containing protein [Vibrio vulnificus]